MLNEHISVLRNVMQAILLSLDAIGLDIIQDQFAKCSNHEMTIEQFVTMMVRMTCHPTAGLFEQVLVDRVEVAQALAELFDTMDLDGNHTIEFGEFLETCIHWGLSAGSGIESRQVLSAPLQKFTMGPTAHVDKRTTRTLLTYIEPLDIVLLFQPNAKKIKLVDPDYLNVTKTLHLGNKNVSAFEWIPYDSTGIVRKLLATSAPKAIQLWEGMSTGGRFTVQSEIPIRIAVTCLKWMPAADLLLGGGTNGVLYGWNLDGVMKKSLTGHSCGITTLLVVPGSHQVLTGSSDRTIRLWDFEFGHGLKMHYKGHQGKVTCLAVNNEGKEFVSGSSANELLVWSLTDRNVLHSINGHKHAVTFVTFVPGSPEFISGDQSGTFMIWDTRLTFSLVQTLSAAEQGFYIGATLCTKRDARLVVPFDVDLMSWDQKTQRPLMRRKREVTEHIEEYLIYAAYVDVTCSFITATSRTVTFWNALNGCLKEQYDDLMDGYEISAICIDDTQRKIIIGDVTGRIRVFNSMSGRVMKVLEGHSGEVIALQYVSSIKTVVSLGRDLHFKAHDEAPQQHCPVILNVNLHHHSVESPTAIATSSNLGVMAVGDSHGRIIIWDIQLGALLEHIRPAISNAIATMKILDPYPLLAVADGTPSVVIYALHPLSSHAQCLQIVDGRAGDIISLTFDGIRSLLYTGDAIGNVAGYSMQHMLDDKGIHPVSTTSFDKDARMTAMRASIVLHHGSVLDRRPTLKHLASLNTYGLPRTYSFRPCDTAISLLGHIQDPTSLVVLSYSPHLSVWTPSGEPLGKVGTLDISRRSLQATAWKFPVNTERRLARANAVAAQVVQIMDQDPGGHDFLLRLDQRKRMATRAVDSAASAADFDESGSSDTTQGGPRRRSSLATLSSLMSLNSNVFVTQHAGAPLVTEDDLVRLRSGSMTFDERVQVRQKMSTAGMDPVRAFPRTWKKSNLGIMESPPISNAPSRMNTQRSLSGRSLHSASSMRRSSSEAIGIKKQSVYQTRSKLRSKAI
ncbi:EF-hand domain-containing protein [Plasmodiophora brassicae]|uniref:EF-hand domain-containing protein n=1 Tax=Plasmodiophora brassicae TaxID=37360 RepID=A0A0G4IS06_PLABS|nr:hypothetical protein PBRA_006068 [Plasmodiophora brassicae]